MSYLEDSPTRAVLSGMAEVFVEILWTQGPGASDGDWCDVTRYVTDWGYASGREYELDDFDAGTGWVTIETFDRLFDPLYTAGPFYPYLIPNRQIRIVELTDAGVRVPIGRGYIKDYGDTIEANRKFTTTISFNDGWERAERVTLPSSFYEFVVSQDRPDHWWKLDEAGSTAIDSGYGSSLFNGTDSSGSVTRTSDGVAYDGGRKAAAYAGACSTSFSPFNVPAQLTLEFWFSCSDTSTAQTIFSLPQTGSGGDIPLAISLNSLATTGIYVWQWTAGSVALTSGSATPYLDGNLHHFVVVIDSTGTYLYLDGVLAQSNVNNDWYDVGGRTDLAPAFGYQSGLPSISAGFTGRLSNVAQYDSRSLTAAQVLDHYNAGKNACSGEDTGARVTRVLNYAQWPTPLRSIDTGRSTVGAYDLDGGSLADYLRSMAQTELGQTYFDGDGKLVHRSRHALFRDTRSSSSQATFGDRASGAACKVDEDEFSMPIDNGQIRNPVRASRSGGVTALALDASLRDDTYGDNTYELPESLDSLDTVMADRAAYILSRYKRPAQRLESLRFTPTTDATNLGPQVARKIGDRITVSRTPLDIGAATVFDVLIQKVAHAGSPYHRTVTITGTQSETRRFWILDDATYSVLDSTTVLAY